MAYSRPITLAGIGLSLQHKTCFENFSVQIHLSTPLSYGSRIALIGRNGSGKSTLLKMLAGQTVPTAGRIVLPPDVVVGYVPQIVEGFDSLSGAQRFNAALTRALASNPNLLLLDEPTNHLDQRNRTSLMRMLRSFQGTLIVVTHDAELLRTCVDTLWHIDGERVNLFSGNYDDYLSEQQQQKHALQTELSQLNRQKSGAHEQLMKEQERAKKSKKLGLKNRAQGKWDTLTADAKERRAQVTAGRNQQNIQGKKQELLEKIAQLRVPEVIVPRFAIAAGDVKAKTILSVSNGSVGYSSPVVSGINLLVGGSERIAIAGDNGSGKSTLIKGIMAAPEVVRSGEWLVPKREAIGYLDQHYELLDPKLSIFENLKHAVPSWPDHDLRRHLNDFLFRKNEEVTALAHTLSGGEKARACLAIIAAKTPALLVLDEVTNNLDLETRQHVIEVLSGYPGALIVISHDQDFLDKIGVGVVYVVQEGRLVVK